MRKHWKTTLAIGLILCLLSACAIADGVSLTGSVVCDSVLVQTASYGGTVENVNVHVGDHVSAGDVLATIETTKVFAEQDGTVRLFGQIGDNAETVATRYGAVAYVEPKIRYTISGSTRNAYNAEANKIIHPGEKVWLNVTSNGHKGTGIVTSVSGNSYTVEVTDGDLVSGESAIIYRDETLASTSKIGKGNTALAANLAYTGTGLIAAFAAEDGAEVHAGDLLFETVSGTRNGADQDLTVIRAETDGVIATLSINAGAALNAGDTVCEINPDNGLRVEAPIGESDLINLKVGDTVLVEFTYVNNGEFAVAGTGERIGMIGTAAAEDSEESSFTVSVKLSDITNAAYGLTAVVSVPDDTPEESAEPETATEETGAENNAAVLPEMPE